MTEDFKEGDLVYLNLFGLPLSSRIGMFVKSEKRHFRGSPYTRMTVLLDRGLLMTTFNDNITKLSD